MKFELYKDAVLARDLPRDRLKRGDIVKLVEHHIARDGEEGYIGPSVHDFPAILGAETFHPLPGACGQFLGLATGIPRIHKCLEISNLSRRSLIAERF